MLGEEAAIARLTDEAGKEAEGLADFSEEICSSVADAVCGIRSCNCADAAGRVTLSTASAEATSLCGPIIRVNAANKTMMVAVTSETIVSGSARRPMDATITPVSEDRQLADIRGDRPAARYPCRNSSRESVNSCSKDSSEGRPSCSSVLPVVVEESRCESPSLIFAR